MAKYCPECGGKIAKTAKYCTHCGEELKQHARAIPVAPAKEVEEDEADDTEEEYEEKPRRINVKQEAPHVETKVEIKNEGGGFWSGLKWGSGCCIGIILAIIILGFVAFLVISGGLH